MTETAQEAPNTDTFDRIFDDGRDIWVFDLDNTLYPEECNLFSQVDVGITHYVSNFLDLPYDDARAVQKRYLMEFGTTLNGLMANHDVDPAHFLERVHDIDFSPIKPDPILKASLQKLSGRKIVFTNADQPYAEKVLERLGIRDEFEGIFDILAADLQPKPKENTYSKFFRDHDIDPTRSVMFEDMVRNLIPAHKAGMATVWINTGSTWGRADYQADIVHSETPALTPWLERFVSR